MKYFGKDFFKFTFGFLLIVSLSLVILMVAVRYAQKAEAAEEIDKIVFTTPEHTVKPNTLSEALTIQTQDLEGNQVQTPETIDLEFVSSSATGQFLNSSGNPATTYMSKNTANRTFYYKDSSEGDFIINVKAIGRDTKTEWNTSQRINISSGELDKNTDQTMITSNISATSGSAIPSYGTTDSRLEVYAGGDRLTSIGSPITFQALIKKNTSSNGSVVFSWSFGDGTVGSGAMVIHSYKYPGEYAVVLNAYSGNTFALSRLKVKVISPNISLAAGDNFVEIFNHSNYEVNLFNWKIINGDKGFIFQPDTIILPKSKINLENSIFTIKGEREDSIILKNFLGDVIASGPKLISKKETITEEFSSKINHIEKEAIRILDTALAKGLIKEKSQNVAAVVAALPLEEKQSQASSSKQSDLLYESPSKKGFLGKLFNLLANILR